MHRPQVPAPLRPLYDKIHRVCEGMFLESNRRNYLREGLSQNDRQKLDYVWKRTGFFAQPLNFLHALFDLANPNQKAQIENLSEGGMTKEYLTSLWAQSMISNFLASVESIFRFTLIFFLDNKFFRDVGCDPKYMTTNRLLRELKAIYQPAEDFDKAFDIDLRSSIAHGAFWFDSGRWYLTSDPHLRKTRQLGLADLMTLTMKANIGAMAFIDVLYNEVGKGTFRR